MKAHDAESVAGIIRSSGFSLTETPTEEEEEEAEKEVAAPVGEGSLLFQAGNLILQENRVAVSMIQRRFKLDFDKAEDMDNVYECHGVKFVVDQKSELLLEGTTIDYIDELDKRGFKIENPNAVKSCGCGSSFQA